METPIRDQIRLDNPWQSQRTSPHGRRVFVPAPWAGTKIHLIPRKGSQLSQPFQAFEFGTWNSLEGEGALDGARLVASLPLHIERVEWTTSSNRQLTVQTDLKGAYRCSLHVTLSATNGQLVASVHQPVTGRADRVRIELDLPAPLVAGAYRLKVVLAAGDQIMDNARVDLSVA